MVNEKLYERKCLSMNPFSNIIITEGMDVFEVYRSGDESYGGIPPEDYKDNYFVRLLPMKADINWIRWYGDDGECNWWNPRVPVYQKDGILHWDY